MKTSHSANNCPIKPTNLLSIANNKFNAQDYLGALKLYSDGIQILQPLRASISWNIELCCRRILEDIKKGQDQSSSEYLEWIIKAIQTTQDPCLAACLEEDQISNEHLKQDNLISIIMPTWNRENTIKYAIKSVLMQTYSNWELLICDDGSTDNTESLVKSFCDSRIRYFKLLKGNGAIARNHGLLKAKGEFITFLDSDNLWSPIFLAVVAKEMFTHNCDIMYTSFIDITIKHHEVMHANLKFKDFNFDKLAFRNFIDLNTLCIRSKIPELYGFFDPRLPRQQDWDLLMRYTCRAIVKGVNKPLVCYFRNDDWNQVTKTMQKEDTRSRIMTKNKALIQRFSSTNLEQLRSHGNDQKVISIKISAPNQNECKIWGDYHYAHALGKSLTYLGWKYRVDCQDAWYEEPSDVILVLRGRHKFFPEKVNSRACFQWIISHPNRLKEDELAAYDHILVASSVFTKKLRLVVGMPITTLYQAYDNKQIDESKKFDNLQDIVFVASSRKQKRDMVEWCYDELLNLDLYGTGWEEDQKALSMLKGSYVDNNKILDLYRSYKIVLNDHWPDMRTNGFISNRIFDACGAGSLVITDRVLGLEELFGDSVVIAENKKDLSQKVNYLLSKEDARKEKAAKAKKIVLAGHTFLHRAEFIDKLSKKYLMQHSTIC